MRLFLLPISTRRTLIYAQRLNIPSAEQQTYLEKGTKRAAKLWADWEKKESGWQKKVVDWGNLALKRIPYEEWGLKSIPPLSARRQQDELSGKKGIEVSFPKDLIPEQKVSEVLRILGTERQAMHKSRLIYSFILMPISAPFALVPIIPNLPFFYLVFRAWSHWRALSGSKHIQFLLDNNLVRPKPSQILDTIYSTQVSEVAVANSVVGKSSEITSQSLDTTEAKDEETMVLSKGSAKMIANALEIPELEMELDRAIWQVETKLKGEDDLKEEKKDLDKAAAESRPTSDTENKR